MRDRLRRRALAFRVPCDALLPLVDNPTPSDTPIGVRVAHNSGRVHVSHRDHVGVLHSNPISLYDRANAAAFDDVGDDLRTPNNPKLRF
jgi:hypothetical protein